jgi:PHD/YefM family antitoxin component YafN of YafNO toxin-antitoxin module
MITTTTTEMHPDLNPNVDLEWVTTSEARETLDALADRVGETGERIVLTRDGKPVAALVHVDDAIYMQALEDRLDNAAAEEALADIERNGAIPWEEIEARLDR